MAYLQNYFFFFTHDWACKFGHTIPKNLTVTSCELEWDGCGPPPTMVAVSNVSLIHTRFSLEDCKSEEGCVEKAFLVH